jgi:hypothetical protein
MSVREHFSKKIKENIEACPQKKLDHHPHHIDYKPIFGLNAFVSNVNSFSCKEIHIATQACNITQMN